MLSSEEPFYWELPSCVVTWSWRYQKVSCGQYDRILLLFGVIIFGREGELFKSQFPNLIYLVS